MPTRRIRDAGSRAARSTIRNRRSRPPHGIAQEAVAQQALRTLGQLCEMPKPFFVA